MNREVAFQRVQDELTRATSEHDPMHSAHEGISVIREEFEELWIEVKKVRSTKDVTHNKKLAFEATHVAAMAIRFMVDVT